MTGNHRQLVVDPRIDRAVAHILSLPILWSDRDEGDTGETVLARGWFRGAGECARILATQARLEIGEGRGFGASWPILRRGAWTVAPAMPVALGGEIAVGIDGEYRDDSAGVWREAGGAEDLFLTPDPMRSVPGAPFDLLWFGDFERFLLRKGTLEIEDLFGVLRVPANPRLLDRLLVCSRRNEDGVLVDLPMIDRSGPQIIEVRRPEDLNRGDHWRNPSTFLESRADIESARSRGATIEAQVIGGATAIFEHDDDEDGWRLRLRDGRYVFTEIRFARRARTLSLCTTLDGEIDALAPGMRGRLVFDLRADLVTLG